MGANKKKPLSRRMTKQGPPESLENFKKRKATGGEGTQERDSKRKRPEKFASIRKQDGAKNTSRSAKSPKKNGVAKKAKTFAPPPIEKAAAENDSDGIDGSDVEEDEGGVVVTGLDALGSASEDEGLDDELIDSGSDVMDSEEEQLQGMWSEDEDDDGALDRLTAANIEGLSGQLDKDLQEEEDDAEAELQDTNMQTNIMGDRTKILGDVMDGEDDEPAQLAPDLRMLRERINDSLRTLENFANMGEQGRSRSEYTQQLLKDICQYYGYSPFLCEKLYNLFTPREAFAFFEANETPRPIVIRTNTLRTHRRGLATALINRGVNLEPVGKWSKVGLQIFETAVPLGATPEYLAGHYILQAASSFLPVMALAPQENERVLDMAAAPGGKTTYISAIMKNTGVVFANDANKARAKGLIGNIHRMGVKNTIVCNYDAQQFPKVMGGFDRILLDAPCSGTGVIAKDPSVKTNKTEKDFMRMPEMQKKLILAAIDSVNHASKTGGYIVYSTCSVTVEENEMVVEYALMKRPNVKLVPTGLGFGKEGFVRHMGKIFHHSMNLTRRYYPHSHNLDGFFVAKFKKVGATKTGPATISNGNGTSSDKATAEVEVDKTPILDDEKSEEEFGGFDDEEDEMWMEKSKKATAKRKGRDPRSVSYRKEKINGKAVPVES